MYKLKIVLRTISAFALPLSLAGCLSPLQKQSAALALATAPVVDQASTAYHAANKLADSATDFKAVLAFDVKDPVYNPRSTPVWLSEKDIQTRLKVLQAFQLYVANLVAITSGTQSPALDAASKAVGDNLKGLANDTTPYIETAFALPTTTASTSTASTATTATTTTSAGTSTSTTNATTATTTTASIVPVNADIRNGIATAANALGQFLVERKIKRELPAIILKMDPNLKKLCLLLDDDLDLIQGRERRDFDTLIDLQTEFLRNSSTLSPEDKRNEIMKLPNIVREQRNTQAQLATLKASIVKLYYTHHALAAVAQGNDPTSLKAQLDQLVTAGSNLGTFYSSQPAN